MKAEGLRDLRDARPFHPFTIHLGDGREWAVNHPKFLATSPAGDVAIVFRPEGGFHLVDVDLVTDLEVRPRAETSSDAEQT